MSKNKPSKVTAKDGHEYHKSATANATIAPTNEASVEAASKTAGLDSVASEFVTILDYEWGLKGYFDFDAISDEYGYSTEELDALRSNPAVLKALTERGIFPKFVQPPAEDVEITAAAVRAKLTPIQLIVANFVLDVSDNRSLRKKLQDAGVTTYQYNGWLRDPDFKAYLQQRAENLIGDIQHEAMLALVDNVMKGDLRSIEYYHEITGRHIRESRKDSGSNQSQTDLQQMIIRIIEIIIDEVPDKTTAERISDRLKALVTGAQVAGVLPAPAVGTIQPPQIAQARELTPEVQELMAKGVGYDQ